MGIVEFVKFFLKNDLFFVCLSIFIEELEVYFLWKGGFKCVMNELSVDVVEKIEFLIKWLGLIFFIYVRSIKIFNVNNLVIGF